MFNWFGTLRAGKDLIAWGYGYGSAEVLARHSSEGDSSCAFAHMIHRNLRFHLTVAIAAFFAFCLATAPAIAAPIKNIVLVHGAWAEWFGWKGVYNMLTKDGYKVSIVQEPETSFQEDVAAISASSLYRMDHAFLSPTVTGER